LKWTKEQQQAIEARKCNLLVAAAAGAGKTAVLVERIIQRVFDPTEPVDVDKLLVVTFTNAAASEMRERIYNAIQVKMEDGSYDSKRMYEQQALLGKSYITTMHSFCLDVLRGNVKESGIDSTFAVADESEIKLIKEEIIDDLLEDWYARELGEEGHFTQIVETYARGKTDDKLIELILNVYEFIQGDPWPVEWLREQRDKFFVNGQDFNFGDTLWGKLLLDNLALELEGILEELEKACDHASMGGVDNYIKTMLDDKLQVEMLLKQCGTNDWKALSCQFESLKFSKLARKDKECDEEIAEAVKKIRTKIKEKVQKRSKGLFSGGEGRPEKEMQEQLPIMDCLVDLVIDFGERYKAAKQKKRIFDFNDMEHIAMDVLSEKDMKGNVIPSKVALEYRERFTEVYVDEYQDTNLIQETIIGLVSNRDTDKPNLFMVGDVKQSIYGFRQARPDLFIEKYNTYTQGVGDDRLIKLFKNFRSRKDVVGSVNYIFSRIINIKTCGMEYDKGEYLNFGAFYPERDNSEELACELILVDKEEGKDEYESVQLEAMATGKRIRELFDSGFVVYDKDLMKYRPVKYKDIVILMRSTAGRGEAFMTELTNRGIPTFYDGGKGFFMSVEIQIVLAFLSIIDNPLQDIPMLAVLRSPIGNFDDNEIVQIRLSQLDCFVNDAMKKRGETADQLSGKITSFMEKIEEYRVLAHFTPTSELIWKIINETGYYAFAGGLPDGESRQANLRLIFDKAVKFDRGSYRGIFNFINFVRRIKSRGGDMNSATVVSENMDSVRIMSIHKSKGLEFPVVFLCCAGKMFNYKDSNEGLLLHKELGFGPDCLAMKAAKVYSSIMKQCIKIKMKNETKAEEMRLLYVALTRPREKLIITACVKDPIKTQEMWKEACNSETKRPGNFSIMNSNSYLECIGMVLAYYQPEDELRNDETDCNWVIKYCGLTSIIEGLVDDVEYQPIEILPEFKEGVFQSEVKDRLEWKYNYPQNTSLPTKLSVSEIKRLREEELGDSDEKLYSSTSINIGQPKFIEDKETLSAINKGTMLHACLQKVDFKEVSSIIKGNLNKSDIDHRLNKMLKNLVSWMVDEEFFTDQMAKQIDVKLIKRFLLSEIGQRLVCANIINREVPFTIFKSMSEIYDKEFEKDELIPVQGIIDCYFEEGDGLVLLDFKSDKIKKGQEQAAASKFSVQMECYKDALEKVTGKIVKQSVVFFLTTGKFALI